MREIEETKQNEKKTTKTKMIYDEMISSDQSAKE